MLQIKKRSFSFSLPHLTLRTRPMELSPVVADDDELSQAIASDTGNHDDAWELTERPDEAELEVFWDNVEKDIAKDPTWVRFEN